MSRGVNFLRKVEAHFYRSYGEGRARAYIGDLGADGVQRQRPWSGGQGSEASPPLKLKAFLIVTSANEAQICQFLSCNLLKSVMGSLGLGLNALVLTVLSKDVFILFLSASLSGERKRLM